MVSRWVVNAGDIRNLSELRSCVVLEKLEHGDDGRRRDIDCQFVFPDGELLDVLGETRDKVSPVSMQRLASGRIFVGTVVFVDRGSAMLFHRFLS